MKRDIMRSCAKGNKDDQRYDMASVWRMSKQYGVEEKWCKVDMAECHECQGEGK